MTRPPTFFPLDDALIRALSEIAASVDRARAVGLDVRATVCIRIDAGDLGASDVVAIDTKPPETVSTFDPAAWYEARRDIGWSIVDDATLAEMTTGGATLEDMAADLERSMDGVERRRCQLFDGRAACEMGELAAWLDAQVVE